MGFSFWKGQTSVMGNDSAILTYPSAGGERRPEKMWTVGADITREEYLHHLDTAKLLDREQAYLLAKVLPFLPSICWATTRFFFLSRFDGI